MLGSAAGSVSAGVATLGCVTRRRLASGAPRDWVDGDWPAGEPLPGAPRALAHARLISVRLTYALAGRNVSAVAEEADLARSTIYDLVGGRTWGDIVSLGKLEEALGVTLLPELPNDVTNS